MSIPHPRIKPLLALSLDTEELLPAQQVSIPNAVVYNNVGLFEPAFARHLERDIYVDRVASVSPVCLARLPPGTRVSTSEDFATCLGDQFVEEQFPVYFPRTEEVLKRISFHNGPQEAVQDEVALIARYGIYTWGHWLGELLPKTIVVEKAYPGRFKYVLPMEVVEDSRPDLPWIRIRQSLEAYGIGPSRMLALRSGRLYQFQRLHAVTSMWSDHVMHPAALQSMRHLVAGPNSFGQQRMTLRRVASYGRILRNEGEITGLLRARGFEEVSFGTASFTEQTRRFRLSDVVCSILGSDLSGILYAPPSVRVLSLAPANFGDRFFYALVAQLGGKMADVRGRPLETAHAAPHKSDFELYVQHVEAALTALGL